MTLPKYSTAAAPALAFVKRPYNDIDVYVEDTVNPNIWLTLVKRVIGPQMRLASVNPLGGRNRVVEACKNDQAPGGRRRIYLIDGDFDFLLGKRAPKLNYLCRVSAYCIENLLVQPDAIWGLALRHNATKPEAQLSAELDLLSWFNSLRKCLLPLFVAYAIAESAGAGVKTSGRSVNSLLKQTPTGPELCMRKTRSVVLATSNAVRAVLGLHKYRKLRRAIVSRAFTLSAEKSISGKSYVAPLILLHLRTVVGFKGSIEQMLLHCAYEYQPKTDAVLRRMLRST